MLQHVRAAQGAGRQGGGGEGDREAKRARREQSRFVVSDDEEDDDADEEGEALSTSVEEEEDDEDVEPLAAAKSGKAVASVYDPQTLRGAHAAARGRRRDADVMIVDDSDEDAGDEDAGSFSSDGDDGSDSEDRGGGGRIKGSGKRYENASEWELERDLKDTLSQCERLSAELRTALGGATAAPGADGDGETTRFAAADAATASALRLLTAEDVVAAGTPEVQFGDAKPIPALKGYQLVGVNFMMLLHSRDMGAILADEMGLGKTAQAISFLACITARAKAAGQPVRPHLVIAPTSVLENWARELAMWAPALRVRLFHGPARGAIREEVDECYANGGADGGSSAQHLLPFDVLLCCYTLFERDSAEQMSDRKWLRSLRFGYCVLDEAHAVKNRSSQRAERLRTVLAKCAPRRLMLTGTPLQNDLSELLALQELLMPRLFAGKAKLLDMFEAQTQGSSGGARKGVSDDTIARVRAMLAPFVLRRLKSEVLAQLTPKTQHLERLDMIPSQKALYDSVLTSVGREMAAKAKAVAAGPGRPRSRAPSSNDLAAGGEAGGAAAGMSAAQLEKCMGAHRLKALFTYLRKVANHPLLVRSLFNQAGVEEVVKVTHARRVFGPGASLKMVQEHVAGLSDFALHSLCCDDKVGSALAHLRLPDDAVLASGKAAWLAGLLPKLKADGRRVLIFSQWKIQLDVLEWLLQRLDMRFFRMDGSTPVEERQQLVDGFNAPDSPIFAFLLSTRAGGQGINLTSADTVIIHDWCVLPPRPSRDSHRHVI
jgi:SWI/SNF-related matrix-associated actin-dependent regulator 1 of chromatin subfamily A